MSKLRSVTLGGKEFPLGEFTLDQVERTAVLLKSIGAVDTVPQADSRKTVIFIGLQSGGYGETYDVFQKIKGVKLPELIQAQLEIGRVIGYYQEKDAAPGEASGGESPSAS